MQMKQLIITFILLSFIITPAIAVEDAITNFVEIVPMPNSIVAGSTYQTEYSFTGMGSIDVEINFTINATEPIIVNNGDWSVFYVLNGVVVTPIEEYPGHFTGNSPIVVDNYELIIQFELLPSVTPGEYGSIVMVGGEQIEVYYPPDDDDGGRSSGQSPYTTSTPISLGTLAPTPTPTSSRTIIVNQTSGDNGTVEFTVIPEEPRSFLWYLLIPLFLIILILVYLYWKKKSEEEEEGVKK